MSKNGAMGPKTDQGFSELAVVRDQPPVVRSQEFQNFVDFWQRHEKERHSSSSSSAETAVEFPAGSGADSSALVKKALRPGALSASGADDFGGDLSSGGGLSRPGAAPEIPPEALDILEVARREAAGIIEEAKVEAAELRARAADEGREDQEREYAARIAAVEKDYKARVVELEKEYNNKIVGIKSDYADKAAELVKTLQAIQGQRGAIVDRYREELLTLITAMTDRLVQHQLSIDPGIIKECFSAAMAYVVENSLVKAHLNSVDFHNLKEAGLVDPSLFGGKNRVQLIEDPAVAAGGCLLKSSFGEVDATMESAKEQLYQAVGQAFTAALAQVPPGQEETMGLAEPELTPEREPEPEPETVTETEVEQELESEPDPRPEEVALEAEDGEPELGSPISG